jgi:primosomal protein N' (replication factor Y)
MFYNNDIVKVLLPIAVGDGYDYRLDAPAQIGTFVSVSVMNRKLIGVIIGAGDSGLPPEKIKPATPLQFHITQSSLNWIDRMSEWTMMPIGMVLKLILNVPEAFAPLKTEQLYIFLPNEKVKMTDARQAVADAFASNDNEPMSISDIQTISHVGASVVRSMVKNETLQPAVQLEKKSKSEIINYFDTKKVKLNPEQQIAADTINMENFSVYLLDGITGSGKTQVYFDSVWRSYAAGKSVLLMMPEIALTAQFINRFESRFGAKPIVWHSNLTAARRRDIWRGVANGEIKIVIGTRSTLFLPWQNLGLIVVDEEHDSSYKQEDMGNYHARDMAILRGKTENFPVILASATPAMETLHNALNGKYIHLKLKSRFGGASMPTIETIDFRKNEEHSGSGFISTTLLNALEKTLADGQQAMLFINRRGYAPIVQCKKCGWYAACPDCSVGMTHHKKNNSLLCHICGRSYPMQKKCPDCGNEDLTISGAGLEKIQEEIIAKFPNAKTALVSSDTMMSRQALERLVSQMESGEINIVIGTQILAKGHHFPNLTLVGVIDADMGLFGVDFRSGEKTFQQLFQVAGRAGRAELTGRVLLQTYQPEHPVLRAICACNRDEFMVNDMVGRRVAKMPPFGQLIAIIIESEKESVLQKFCADLSAVAPKIENSKIMGPIPAQIYKIRTWYRMRFLIAGEERASMQSAVKHWLGKVKHPSNIRVKIDVNPQNFM